MRVKMSKAFDVVSEGSPAPVARNEGDEVDVDNDTGAGLVRDKLAVEVKATAAAPENKDASGKRSNK